MTVFEVGDRVTVTPDPDDPLEIHYHRHAVVAEVVNGSGEPGYIVGHPGPCGRRFGPYPQASLAAGWQHHR